jgi:hypothetical protein
MAEKMLSAHVEFILHELTDAPLKIWIDREVDALLADAAHITLAEAVSPALILETVKVFAVELDLKGGIPELIADIARVIYQHPALAKTTAGDLISATQLQQMTDKVLELKSLREELLRAVLSSPLFTSFTSDLLYHGIRDYLAHSSLGSNIPGASSMFKLGKAALGRAGSKLEGAVEDGVRKTIAKTVSATAGRSAELLLERLDDDTLRSLVMEIFAQLKSVPIAGLRQYISALDLEEMLVMGYEYWGTLRGTALYSTLINAGVQAFFDQYGSYTLAELLEDLGVTRALIAGEAHRYGPPVLKALNKKHLLEPMVRRWLQPFYASEAFAKAAAG